MEDAHILKSDFAPDCSIFGVFDGHGGKEVSMYVEKHFIAELQKNPNFSAQKFEDALIQTFLKMDELMRTPEGQKEVLSYKDSDEECTFKFVIVFRDLCWLHCQRGSALQEHALRGQRWRFPHHPVPQQRASHAQHRP
jgi:hypothetical protein